MDGESDTLNCCQNVKDERKPVQRWDLCTSLGGCIAYICDVCSDIYVASKILRLSQYVFFAAVIMFTILPLSISTLTSYIWYKKDHINLTKWDIFLHWVLLAPFARYLYVFNYARRSYYAKEDKEKKLFLDKYLFHNADIAFIVVMEAFLEAEPQLILQLSLIMPKSPSDSISPEWDRILPIALSLVSVSLAIANFHASLRRPQSKKNDISRKGLVCQFLWHLMITGSRVISLSCLVSVCPYCALCGYIVHIFIFFSYFFKYGPGHLHCGMHFIMACVHVFVAIPIRDGPSRIFYSIVYFVFFLENIVCVSIWYWKMTGCYLAPILISASVLSFLMGLFFMILYYKCFHPNKLSNPQKQPSNQPQEEI